MTNTNSTAKKSPAYIAYFIPERERAAWTRIGAAWPHADRKGFNIDLEMIPVCSGRITLRQYEAKAEEAGA